MIKIELEKDDLAKCKKGTHSKKKFVIPKSEDLSFERAASLFRALGDEGRLKLLFYLSKGELCVTEICELLKENSSTVSQRLKLLRSEGLVKRRREGKHLFYSLVDEHILNLINNSMEHVKE